MEKKSSETLEHKRSFFVRMVSDPKLYNPKIVKMDRRQKLLNMGITSDCSDLSPMWVPVVVSFSFSWENDLSFIVLALADLSLMNFEGIILVCFDLESRNQNKEIV